MFRSKYPRLGVAAVTVALAASSVVAASTPAQATVFKYPPNQLSPQFKKGNCLYKIRYGNFGNVAYSQVRVYTSACSGIIMTVVAQRGSSRWQYGGRPVGGGTDGCGGYFENQATSPADYIGVGMQVYFPEVNAEN